MILFGYPVSVYKMPRHADIQNQFDEYVKDDQYFSTVEAWHSNVETTFRKKESLDLPWDLVLSNLQDLVDKFISENFTLKTPSIEIKTQAWLNRYKQFQYQEVHTHSLGNNMISCAYMLKVPEKSSKFLFYKEEFSFWDNAPISYQGQTYDPNLAEGDVVFFPSNLSHFVTPNESTDIRLTISANFFV